MEIGNGKYTSILTQDTENIWVILWPLRSEMVPLLEEKFHS